jgi:glycosyltransferase involved in cell wall biosynthesis
VAKPNFSRRAHSTHREVRVVVNGVPFGVGGGGTYLLSQMIALSRRADVHATVYASGTLADRLAADCPGVVVRQIHARPLVLRLLWEQLVLPLRARKTDVIYVPGNFSLLLSRNPQVLVLQNPHHFGNRARQLRKRLFPLPWRARLALESVAARGSVRRAYRVIAISNALAQTVEQDLGSVDHLRVIPSAPPERSSPSAREGAGDYALSVANDYPHKDWEGLIKAFLRSRDLPRLVLVGAARSADRLASLRAHIEGVGPQRVQLLGLIDDPTRLDELYANAACYIAHSYLEAFPLTPFEALAHGLPVVASDIPSHREVCAEAATYYDPERPDELARAVKHVVRRPRPSGWPALMDRSWDDNAADLVAELAAAAGRYQRAGRQ